MVLLLVAQSIVRISPWALARLAIGMQTSRFRFATLAAGALTERKRAAEQRKVLALSTLVMAGLLFGVEPSDPLAFASVAAVMLLLASAASFLPALRASRVDPVRALRYE